VSKARDPALQGATEQHTTFHNTLAVETGSWTVQRSGRLQGCIAAGADLCHLYLKI